MNKAEKQVAAASLRDEATVIRQTRENYKEARANIEEKLKVLADREQTQSVIWQKQYQEALKQQLDMAIDTLSSKNYANIHQYLEGEYENGFIGTMYSLQKQGIPLVMPIDQTRVVKMVETGADGIKLSKRMYGNTTKLKNAVRREVSIGFASGESYQQVAGRLSRTMGVDYNKTIRIARTEGGRVANASRFDAMTGAKKSGADIVKQWDSTLDARTRPEHRELDGQVAELEDKFKIGQYEAEHPHDFGVPWLDINCRCVVLQRARWAVEGEGYEDYTKYSRFAEFERDKWLSGELDKTVQKHGGQIIDLSDAKNFADFKERYKQVAKNIVAQQAAVAIGVEVIGSKAEQGIVYREAATKKSALEFASEELGFEKVPSSLKLDELNALNAGFTKVMNQFPFIKGHVKQIKSGKMKAVAYYDVNRVEKGAGFVFEPVFKFNAAEMAGIEKAAETEVKYGFWSKKQGLDGIIMHEATHSIEYKIMMKRLGIVEGEQLTLTQIIGLGKMRGKVSEEIVTEAFKREGIEYTKENVEKRISKYAGVNSLETLAEAISCEDETNGLCNAIKAVLNETLEKEGLL